MTARQIEKELERQKVLFEEECSGIVCGGSVKFADYANEWMKFHAEKELKASTVSRYRRLLPAILTAIGHIRLEKLNPLHIQRMIDNLGESGINRITGKTLAPKTIGHYLSLTSAICADAAAKHLIKENPCRGIKLPKADHKERVIFTLEEAQTFLRALSQEPLVYQAFFVLAIYGGFCKGELLGLEWKDVDDEDEPILAFCRG
jgi:integrase